MLNTELLDVKIKLSYNRLPHEEPIEPEKPEENVASAVLGMAVLGKMMLGSQ